MNSYWIHEILALGVNFCRGMPFTYLTFELTSYWPFPTRDQFLLRRTNNRYLTVRHVTNRYCWWTASEVSNSNNICHQKSWLIAISRPFTWKVCQRSLQFFVVKWESATRLSNCHPVWRTKWLSMHDPQTTKLEERGRQSGSFIYYLFFVYLFSFADRSSPIGVVCFYQQRVLTAATNSIAVRQACSRVVGGGATACGTPQLRQVFGVSGVSGLLAAKRQPICSLVTGRAHHSSGRQPHYLPQCLQFFN